MKCFKGWRWLVLMPLPLLAGNPTPSLAMLEYLADLQDVDGQWTGPMDMEMLEWVESDEGIALDAWLDAEAGDGIIAEDRQQEGEQ